MRFFWDRKDLAWLASGFALEVGLWIYFLFAMAIENIAIDVGVVLAFIAGLHFLFKRAIRRYERPLLLIAAVALAVLGVVASELVAAVSSAIMGGGEFSYTFERDALGYLALFGVHFVPAALCAYGVRRPVPPPEIPSRS
jgi:hypothetical protein